MGTGRTWDDNWNNVFIKKIFQDTQLKDLMLIPEDKYHKLVSFRDKYFIRDVEADELLTDEKVRVIYYEEKGTKFGNPNVLKKYLCFDIYVKKDEQYNADVQSGMKERTKLISERIRHLLTDERHVYHMSFSFEDSFDLKSKVVGYVRYHLLMSYKITI